MGFLNPWQKLDRVLPGLPFGNGYFGSGTIASDLNTRTTISGNAGQTTSTLGSSILSNGDVVIISQIYGSGNYEIQRVASGGGTTSIVWQVPLQYSYGGGAQVVKFSLYSSATVNSHSLTGWNGTLGGIEVICANTRITVNGSLNANSLGFRGGSAHYQGEGNNGIGAVSQDSNGNGGGGGANYGGDKPGAGGGNAGPGGGGSGSGGTTTGGSPAGASDLTTIAPGGGGGGGYNDYPPDGQGSGGPGGGIFFLISREIIVNGNIVSNGGGGGGVNTGSSVGGGGAGGSIMVMAQFATLGSNLITAYGGPSGNGGYGWGGGDGSAGRIAVHHSGLITGSTNPGFTDIYEPQLVQNTGGVFII